MTCETLSNVRVTDRAVQETILPDVQRPEMRASGQFSFRLPADMADAQISAPMLRQKTIAPVGEAADAPLRVNVELQDEMMDQVCVLVKNDRLLAPSSPTACPSRRSRPVGPIDNT